MTSTVKTDQNPVGQKHHRGMSIIYILIALCTLIELLLQLGDLGFLTSSRFRSLTYENAGFWGGLLRNWQPNYPLQPWLMFLSYGFLHAGILHLIVNMFTLFSLGRIIIERVGPGKFALLYTTSILGGAIGFALLSDSYRPMVGASGALFGLAGALLAWDYVDRFNLREKLWPVARSVIMLITLNIVLYFAMDRLLAWETHLGGFLAGWFMATLLDPRGRA